MTLPTACILTEVAFSPDDKRLAFSSYDTTVRLWDTETGVLQNILEGHGARIITVTFSPNRQRLASTSGITTVRLWDSEIGALQSMLEG